MSLVSRVIEAAGIPTVIAGSARDIVEECGVARFVFTDFPLGNPIGKPGDVAMQRAIAGMALETLEHAWEPRTTVQTPFVWNEDDDQTWRDDFLRVDDSTREALAAAGEAGRAHRAEGKASGRVRTD